MAGPALGDLVFGRFAPPGRLPVTWPKAVGQIPIYYNHTNTGRPADDERYVQIDDIPVEAWQSSLGNQSHYLDLGFTPQYPFGFGLSYTEFEYADLELSGSEIGPGETLTVSARVTNTGTMAARETVQLYTRDLVADLTRPVRELKDFRKVFLEPGASATVRFELRADQLGYYDAQGNYATEPGAFHVWVGPSAASGLRGGFNVVP
jgi:beta-glucosidase